MPSKGSKTASDSDKLYDVGTLVMAKWPNSSLYFKGKVIDYNDVEYLVEFDDDLKSEYPVKYKNVHRPFARSRSNSRGRSPGRPKSPGRKASTSKSPSRKSPGRKPASQKTIVSSSTDLSSSASLRTRPKTVVEKVSLNSSNSVSTRRQSARLADKSSQPSGMKSKLTSVLETVKGKNKLWPLTKRAVVGLWVTLSSLFLPALILITPFVLSLMCTAKNCSFSWVEFPQKFTSYYDQKAVTYAAAFTLCLFVLSLLPVGKTVKAKSGTEVRCNGYISLIALTAGVVGVLKAQYNLSPIYLLFRHFLVTFSGFGILLSLVLYVKSFFITKSNIYTKGITGYYLVDFINGRELNPRIRSFDVKFFVYRLAVFLNIILNFLIVAKDLQSKHGQYSPTLLVCCGIQIFYSIDHVVFEDSFFSTFDYLKQGTGFTTIIGYLTLPFFFTVYSRYILNHGNELPWYGLLAAVIVGLVGYTIYRGSTSQKHAFRVNPNDPALVHLESVPATGGKRLLVSGWFGLVRHPEILGEILGHISLASLCGCGLYVPYVVTVLLLSCSVARMHLDEKASRAEYGLSWNNYVSRVPYRVIPKVF